MGRYLLRFHLATRSLSGFSQVKTKTVLFQGGFFHFRSFSVGLIDQPFEPPPNSVKTVDHNVHDGKPSQPKRLKMFSIWKKHLISRKRIVLVEGEVRGSIF